MRKKILQLYTMKSSHFPIEDYKHILEYASDKNTGGSYPIKFPPRIKEALTELGFLSSRDSYPAHIIHGHINAPEESCQFHRNPFAHPHNPPCGSTPQKDSPRKNPRTMKTSDCNKFCASALRLESTVGFRKLPFYVRMVVDGYITYTAQLLAKVRAF